MKNRFIKLKLVIAVALIFLVISKHNSFFLITRICLILYLIIRANVFKKYNVMNSVGVNLFSSSLLCIFKLNFQCLLFTIPLYLPILLHFI